MSSSISMHNIVAAQQANNIPVQEFGAMLCRLSDGRLTRGPIGVGTATSVQFVDVCPPGSTIAGSFHSHPKSGGGSPLPSAQDMREAARIKMPNLCIVTSEKTSCYKVAGVKAAQTALRNVSLLRSMRL